MLGGQHNDIVHVGYTGRLITAWKIGVACSSCCIGIPLNQSIIGHFIMRGMGCLARGDGWGKPNGCIPCCLERLDICRVWAPVILVPHVPEAIIAVPIHVKTNFLKILSKTSHAVAPDFCKKAQIHPRGSVTSMWLLHAMQGEHLVIGAERR